jgi:hypothetical protein
VRIRPTTRLGASPNPISIITGTDNSIRFDYRWATPLAKVPVTGLLPSSAVILTSAGLHLFTDLTLGEPPTILVGELRSQATNPLTVGGARA